MYNSGKNNFSNKKIDIFLNKSTNSVASLRNDVIAALVGIGVSAIWQRRKS